MYSKITLTLSLVLVFTFVFSQNSSRKTILLDEDWKFTLGEIPNAAAFNNDDSSWETVCVPHDWAISKLFDLNQDMQWVQVKEDGDKEAKLRTGRTGALPIFGVAWY